ncbi:hypothetical protein Tco_0502570 [Tanacetum coccineum]
MVACLERSDENAKFHQIVDFLTTSSFHYALTVSPTIYASYIEQFWATNKSKTVNDVKQIHATVDGKTVVISLSTVRSDLHFNDEDVEGEGLRQPSEPQPPSSTGPPSQVTTVATQYQKTHKPRRAKRVWDTEIPQSSGPSKKVSDEAVYTGEDDRVVRAATTASSLEAEFETASKKSHDPPLSKGNTSGSGEDSMEHQVDLKDFVPPTPHDLPLPGGHTLGSDEAEKESQKIGKGTKGKNSRDNALQDWYLQDKSTAGPLNVIAVGPSTITTGDIFDDEMTTIADTLLAIRSARPRTTSVMIRNVEEEPRRATPVPIVQSQDKGKGKMVEPEPTLKNPRKAHIYMDEELAQRVFEEEQTQFEKERRITKEKATEQEAKDAALIEQMEDVQARMDADELLAERLQQKEREQFTVDEQTRMLVDLIAERKKFFAA